MNRGDLGSDILMDQIPGSEVIVTSTPATDTFTHQICLPGATQRMPVTLAPALNKASGSQSITIIRLPQFTNHNSDGNVGAGVTRIQPLRLKMVRPGSAGTPSISTNVSHQPQTGAQGGVNRHSQGSAHSNPSIDLRKVAEEEPVCLSGGSSPSPPIPPDSHLNQPLQLNSIAKQYYWTVFGEYVKVNEEDSLALYGSDPTRPPRLVTDEMKRVYLEKKGRWPIQQQASTETKPGTVMPKVEQKEKPPPKEKSVPKRKQSSIQKDKSKNSLSASVSAKTLAKKSGTSVTDPQNCKHRKVRKVAHPCWIQSVNDKLLPPHKEAFKTITPEKLASFSVDEVASFISLFNILSPIEIETLKKQKIDGEALLLLEQDDLLTQLNLKLGKSLKFINMLLAFKHS